MTLPRTPHDDSGMADVMDTDADIELLRRGGGPSADPTLRMIVDLRDDVDRRTAALLGQLDNDQALTLLEAALTRELTAGIPFPATRPARTRRKARQRRLAVIPLAGALVLGSTGVAAALSGSPSSTLYPLHQVIFGSAASSDGQIARDVEDARSLLDRAAGLSLARRSGPLTQARVILNAAQGLLPSASSTNVRTRLSREIAAAQLRAMGLTQPLEHPSEIKPQSTTPATTPSAPSHPGDDSAPSLGSDERLLQNGTVAPGDRLSPPTQTVSEPMESKAAATPAPSAAFDEGIPASPGQE
jgi:hypothetical protein